MATLLLGAAGAVIGGVAGPGAWYASGAMLGWSIGTTVGGMIDAQKAPSFEGDKLSDRKLTGSQYGSEVPRVWGSGRIGGQLIWAKVDATGNHLVEHQRTSGGGGGSRIGGGRAQSTTTWASATFAIAFAQVSHFRRDSSHAQGGTITHRAAILKKLFFDDELVYDADRATNQVTPTWHDGSPTQAPDSIIVAAAGVSSGSVQAYQGLAYAVFDDVSLERYGNRIPNIEAIIETPELTLADVIRDVVGPLGITASQLDLTAATDVVTGYVASATSDPAGELTGLLLAYSKDLVEVDGKLKIVARGGSSQATIPMEHLGAALGLPGPGEPFQMTRRMVSEMSGRVDVIYYDAEGDLQQATASAVRQSASSKSTRTIQVPMAMTSDEARALAQYELDREYSEIADLTASLLPRYRWLAPGDVITITLPTGNQRFRLGQMDSGLASPVQIAAVADAADVVNQSPPGAGGITPPDPPSVVPTTFVAWSGREILDDHCTSAGFYVAGTGGAGWSGATVYYSLDAGSTWLTGPNLTGRAVFGEAEEALSATGATANAWDLTNEVDIDLTESLGSLENKSESQVEGGDNQCILGGEILGFQVATLIAANRYTLSDLLRGERSTPMSGHATGDRFVLLTPAVVRIQVPDSYAGETVKVKAVSPYQTLADVTAVDVVIAAKNPTEQENRLRALFLPIMVTETALHDAAGNVTTWTTLDASAVLPAGAAMAYINCTAPADQADALIEVRKDSSSISHVAVQVGELGLSGTIGTGMTIVALTGSRTFQFKATNTDTTRNVKVTVWAYVGS